MKCVDCNRPGIGKCDVHLLEWWSISGDALALDMCDFLCRKDGIHWWCIGTVVATKPLNLSPSWREALANEFLDANTKMLRDVSFFVRELAHRRFLGLYQQRHTLTAARVPMDKEHWAGW